jgi:hypothetical protein
MMFCWFAIGSGAVAYFLFSCTGVALGGFIGLCVAGFVLCVYV